MRRARRWAWATWARRCQSCSDNLGKILEDLGTDFELVVQFTTYITSADFIPAFMAARAAVFPKIFPGGKYPPNTLLVVNRLVKPEFLIEIEAIARIPG